MREFRNVARTGKTRVWRIGVEGDQVITEFGELNGKMQTVTDTGQAKNKGRSNYISPEEDALSMMERQILLKTREGYTEVGTGTREEEISWDGHLPTNLCFYKPDNTLSKALEKKLESGDALLTRKRDGEMMVVVKRENGEVHIYSRRMLPGHHLEEGTGWEWRHRFFHVADELEEIYDFPPCSILLGEMVAGTTEDDRWHVASVMKSKTEEALELQEQKGGLCYYVWDVAFWDGEDLLSTTSIAERHAILHHVFSGHEHIAPVETWRPDEVLVYAHRKALDAEVPSVRIAAMSVASAKSWEGWVVIDPAGVFGDKGYNFRGKPDRPGPFSGKLKPEFEDDFIAFFNPDSGVGKWGRGKHQGQVGSVRLVQINSAGEEIDICDCGGGMDDEFRAKYSDPDDYPLVLKVKYTGRTYISQGEKTNALQFPRVIEVRTDKSLDECINDEL